MKKIFLGIFMCLCSYISVAQRKQSVMINALGTTPLIGLKYDIRMLKESRNGFGANLGVGFIDMFEDFDHKVTFAVGPNYLVGNGSHQLLLGASMMFVFSRYYPFESDARNELWAMFIPDIGYRFTPRGKGFTGQVTWNPLRSNLDRESAYQYFGIGLGFAW